MKFNFLGKEKSHPQPPEMEKPKQPSSETAGSERAADKKEQKEYKEPLQLTQLKEALTAAAETESDRLIVDAMVPRMEQRIKTTWQSYQKNKSQGTFLPGQASTFELVREIIDPNDANSLLHPSTKFLQKLAVQLDILGNSASLFELKDKLEPDESLPGGITMTMPHVGGQNYSSLSRGHKDIKSGDMYLNKTKIPGLSLKIHLGKPKKIGETTYLLENYVEGRIAPSDTAQWFEQ